MMYDPMPLRFCPIISVLHPSRSRAGKSFNTITNWKSRIANKEGVNFIISLDSDDPQLMEYIKLYEGFHLLVGNNCSSVEAINNAAKVAKGDILMVVSDDMDCPNKWDASILRETQGKEDWIMKTQDGIQPWIITMPLMDRKYFNRTGHIYYPDYKHLFPDTDQTCVADILGRKITSNLLFPHNHYSIGKATLDSVYSKNDRTNEQGEKLFLERYARNFDLPPGNKIQDHGMIEWLKKRHVA